MTNVSRSLIALFALMPVSALAQRNFGAANFVPPAGWVDESRASFQQFTRAQGQHRCMLLLSADEPAPASLDAAFTKVWTAVFVPTNYRRADRPTMAERVSPAGQRYAFGEGDLEDRAGNRLVARLHVFPLEQKMQSVILLGSSRAAFDVCGQDLAAFFGSLRFRAGSSAPAATAEARGGQTPNETISSGASETLGNITVAPPVGWSVRRDGGVLALAPVDTKGMEALQILVLPGRRFAGSLATEIQSGWGEVASLLSAQLLNSVNGGNYDLEQPTPWFRGIDYLRANGGMRRGDGNYSVDLIVFHVGDRAERMAVVSREFRDNVTLTTTRNNPVYDKAVGEVIFRAKFANQPDRAIAPAGLRAGGIVGVWAGLSMSMSRISTNFAIFFDNGMAWFAPHFPPDGLLGIDPVVDQPRRLRNWGTYTLTGDGGVMTMPYGKIPLRRTATGLELTTNNTVHKFVQFTMPDAPLDGTWCVSSTQCLRLAADGRFEDTGAVRAIQHPTYPVIATPPSGRGRYAIRTHTLVLTYDGGAEVRVAFAGLMPGERAPTPNDLWLGYEPDRLTRR